MTGNTTECVVIASILLTLLVYSEEKYVDAFGSACICIEVLFEKVATLASGGSRDWMNACITSVRELCEMITTAFTTVDGQFPCFLFVSRNVFSR